MNVKFQNAINGVEQAVPPIWFMRQDGRYHQHYQKLRAKHSFMELCKEPQLAAQVALGPIEDFDFDVAILFSDLLFPLEALGFGLTYENTGPELEFRLSADTMSKLCSADEALPHLQFQKQAMQETRKVLPESKSLIGFVGGPWTLFAYAVEGSHAGGLTQAKRHLHLFQPFLEKLLPLLEKNIQLQLEGGAEAVMIFDTAAGELTPEIYQQIVYPTLKRLARKFPKQVGYYARGVTMDHLATTVLADEFWLGLGVDHRFDLSQILKRGWKGFIQGNFDQHLLFADSEDFQAQLEKYLTKFKSLKAQERARWICGLGHGVLPKTPEANVRTFVQYVRQNFK